ncbi:TrmH family RNA methyltransferase [Rhodothermus marinus]|uniref:TrmH family RNA methyltransferase n=1 Tax=Rhodothermus marinus TaxID=29549 RepID=UPI0037CAE24E
MLTRRRLKELARLHRRKDREALGQYLVEGVRLLAAALEAQAPLVEVLVTAAARRRPEVQALLARVAVPVAEVSEQEMARLSEVETSQGVLAVARTQWQPEAHLLRCRRILALDGLQDPGNAGTILRAAAWFGIEAVVAGAGTVDLYNPKVVRAAMGSHWDLALVRTGALPDLLARLQANGVTCYGADLEGTPAARWQPREPAVLVLGSEAHGLQPAVRERLTARVTVPGSPRRQATESLNVAMAATVLLYEWLGRIG